MTADTTGWQRVGNTLAEVKTDNGDGLKVMQIGTWTHVDGKTGRMTRGDDWMLERAISRALHAGA